MKQILSMHIKLTKEDSKKNIPIPFTVPSGCKKLIVRFGYSPKTPEDKEYQLRLARENIERDAPGDAGAEYKPIKYLPLKNLVTLSLDDPSGYRGAAHRQRPRQKHIISKDFASPGFIPGDIKEGAWRISLDVHALITDECECRVEILSVGGVKNEA